MSFATVGELGQTAKWLLSCTKQVPRTLLTHKRERILAVKAEFGPDDLGTLCSVDTILGTIRG